MKKIIFSILLVLAVFGCKDDEVFSPINVEPSFQFTLDNVPYSKLSDYHFFKDEIKNQIPSQGILPYAPASSSFSNYAKKKRFIWLPKNLKALYNGDGNTLEFPMGTVIIKTFYYDNVLPDASTKNLETRLLVKKNDGWKAYNYIWNDNQTEAFLDSNGQGKFVSINWIEKGIPKSVEYSIPSQTECVTCHKLNQGSGEKIIPLGTKPQNLNSNFTYIDGIKNQLLKWKEAGFLGNDLPTSIVSTVNWEDATQSLELRARSYLDINCATCHREGSHCDYVPQRFEFSNTNLATLGVCLVPTNTQHGNYVIQPGNAEKSAVYKRMNTNAGSIRMPIIGRSIIDEEGLALIKNWIDGMPPSCN